MAKALPQKGRALSLTSQFNLSLINSFKYLLDACEEVIPPSLFQKSCERLNSLDPQSKLSGFFIALHTDFVSAVEAENIERINIIAQKLSTETIQVENINFINIGHLDNYYLPVIKNICTQEIPEKIDLDEVNPEEFDKMKRACEQGLKIIESSCPDYFEEANFFISDIIFFKADRLKHCSSISSFGLVYRNFTFGFEKITDTVDILIHELAHLYLFLLNINDKIVINFDELHDSPLRADKRPLIGIYHAAFVLARVIDVLQKALKCGEIPSNERDYCKNHIEIQTKRFHMSMDELNAYAQMTPLGKALITSASQLVEESYAASADGAVMPRAVI